MARMKAGPKIILGIILVGGLAFAGNFAIDHLQAQSKIKAETAAVEEKRPEVKVEAKAETKAPEVKTEPIQETKRSESTTNSGLAGLLESGKK